MIKMWRILLEAKKVDEDELDKLRDDDPEIVKDTNKRIKEF